MVEKLHAAGMAWGMHARHTAGTAEAAAYAYRGTWGSSCTGAGSAGWGAMVGVAAGEKQMIALP